MDFENMKRKELQALCKKHNIPANLSNSQMAQNLASLLQEKEKTAKRGKKRSKASAEIVEEKDSSDNTRQPKKVRFSPTNETFEYVELRSGRKEKMKVTVTQTKSSLKPASKNGGNTVVEKVDIKSNKEVAANMGRSLRSRVQATVEDGEIPVLNPPVGRPRGRRAGKDADNAESTEEIVIKPVRVSRSKGQTLLEGDSMLVPEQQVRKNRGRPRAVGNVDGVEPVEDIVSIPVRTTRSRAQISVEGGNLAALKPKAEKVTSARGVVNDVELAKGIVDAPVRTTRFRVQTSKEVGVGTMPSLPVEKKRARKGSKVGDVTVRSTVEVLDLSDNVVSSKAASDQAEDLPLKRSLRKRELGDADIKGGDNTRQKTAKGSKVLEDEPLAKDGGIKEPDLCLRRSTRNVGPVRETTISKQSSVETEMVGRGKITRSKNQMVKEDNKNKAEAAVMVQSAIEVVLPVESRGRTGRNANWRKSVMPEKTGNVVKSQGDSEMAPLLEEPERHPARKGRKWNSVMPKNDEVKAAESKAEKGDILKENEIVVPHSSPLRRSRRQPPLQEPITPTDDDLASPVVGGRERSGKQSHAVSGGNAAEESPRRYTRSATKSVGNPVTSSSLEKNGGKRKQQRTVIPNSLAATPSGASALSEESFAVAQVSMPVVTEISTDLVSGSTPVSEDSSSKKRSERQSTRSSKQEGVKEVFAKPSILEQAKGQTSVSKSKRLQMDGGEKEKEISVRKRRDHLFKEDRLETSPKRFTRSATKHEKRTEWNLPENSAGKKTPQSRSRPPKLVVDGDSVGKGTPSIDTKFSMPEVFRSPTNLFSGSTRVVKDRVSERRPKSSRSTRSLKQGGLQEVHAEASNVDEEKGQLPSSVSRKLQTDDRQGCKLFSDRKERGEITLEEVEVGMKCTPPAEESSRRLTRSAFKSNSNAATNLTGKSIGKKMFKNQSETPKLEVKTPSSNESSAIHGLANINDAPLSLPEAVDSASGPAREVICGTSSKMGKKVSTSGCTLDEDGAEEVCAPISNITEGKDQTLNLEETLASEMLQIDEIEKKKEVSIEETAVITEKMIALEEEEVGMKCTPPAEESSRRLTRSAFKSNSNAATNLTGKSVGKKKFKNQSETPKLEVKTPSFNESSAIHGLANINDAPLSLPEAVNSASGPAREVICGTSSKMGKKVSTSGCTLDEDGAEEVCAPISNITEGKDQTLNLEETLASEMLQIDEIEKENEVSIEETAVITEKMIAPVNGPTHVINGIATSTAFCSLGLPNMEKEIPLEEGASTHSIDIVPEVLASAIERSIEIEHTSGQESAWQFPSTTGVSESESIDFKIEVPSEQGTSALEGAHSTAAVPEVSGEANHPVLSSSGIFEHTSFSQIKNSSTESHVNEEGISEEVCAKTLSLDETKGQEQKETEMYDSADEAVDVAKNVNILLGAGIESLKCSAEMVNEHGPVSHSLERSGLSGSSKLADQEVMDYLSVTADDGFDGTVSTAVGGILVEQSHSPTKVEAMLEPSTDAQPSPAASDVLVRDNGVNSLNDQISVKSVDCNTLSKETVGDTCVEDDLLAFNQSGGSSEIDEGINQDAARGNQDGGNLIEERNYEETENNMESAKPHEFSSSPARQSTELNISCVASSFAAEELPLQVPEVIESANTPSRNGEKACESFDGTVVVSGTKSFSEKQKCSVKVGTGPSASNEIVDSVAMDLENAQDFNLQTLQSEQKTVELDRALEENSVDHSHNSDSAGTVKSPICDVAIPGTFGSDDVGFENKMESAGAKGDFTSSQDEQKVVESDAQAKGGENAPNSVEEISGSGSFTEEKNMQENLHMIDNDGKASDMGAQMDDTYTASVYIVNAPIDKNISHSLPTNDKIELGMASKKVVGHSFDEQEFHDTVPAEECQHEECPSPRKENQLQVTGGVMIDGIHSESEQDFQLQVIFETPASKDLQECDDIVPGEESQHGDFHCKDNQLQSEECDDTVPGEESHHSKDNQLQSEEDYQFGKLSEYPASKGTLESEDRVRMEESQHENGPSKVDEMQSEQEEGNALSSMCEDMDYSVLDDDWHEGTLPTLSATPGSSNISSKNARSYCHGEIADIVFSDIETQEIRNVENHSNCFENDLENVMVSKCNTSTTLSFSDFEGEDRKQELELNSQMIFIKEREKISSVSAEEQPGEPEDHMKHVSDRTIHEDDELSEGFDAYGDTEQYFHSEHAANANFEYFGGNTQDLSTEVTTLSGHDYAALDEPGVKAEVNRVEEESITGSEDDRPMVGWNGEERETKESEEAAPEKNTRTVPPTDMTSRTNLSVSVDFANDKEEEKPDAKAEEGNNDVSAEQLGSTSSIAVEKDNVLSSLISETPSRPVGLVDMKENAQFLKGEIAGTFSAARPIMGRHALEDLQNK